MKRKIVGISLGAIFTLTSFTGVYIQTRINSYESSISQDIENFNKSSEKIKIEKVQSNNNFFDSSGEYNIKYLSATGEFDGELNIKYKLEHGLWNWIIMDEIPFVANSTINGKALESLKIKYQPINFNGSISRNGSFKLLSDNINFDFVVPKPTYNNNNSDDGKLINEDLSLPKEIGMHVQIKNLKPLIVMDSKKHTIFYELTQEELFAKDLEDPKDNITVSNAKIRYEADIDNLNLGNLFFSFDKANDALGDFSLDNFSMKFGIDKKQENYNANFSLNLENLNSKQQNNTKIGMDYSIENINKNMIILYKKITTKYAIGDELSDDDMGLIKATILENLKNGFSFNIKNINYSNESSFIGIQGKAEISPLVSIDDDFDLAKQSNFSFNLKTKGEMAETINTMFVGSMDEKIKEIKPDEPTRPILVNDTFDLNIKYEKNLLMVNNFPAPTMVNYFIFNSLSSLNKTLGFSKNNNNSKIFSNEHLDGMERELTKNLQLKK